MFGFSFVHKLTYPPEDQRRRAEKALNDRDFRNRNFQNFVGHTGVEEDEEDRRDRNRLLNSLVLI